MVLTLAIVAALVGGCTGGGPAATGDQRPGTTPGPSPTVSAGSAPEPLPPATSPAMSPARPGGAAPRSHDGGTTRPVSPTAWPGWTVTVYYTAVERFHTGARVRVTGCPTLDCVDGDDELGTYPETFVRAVRDEGTGRTAADAYLNWSHDTGFWLDEAPRDTAGRRLRPFQSAAADQRVLPQGARFTITACGHDEEGERIAAEVCSRLQAARWTISDEFTPGLGGQRHTDVYIGEETGPNFTEGPWYVTLFEATLRPG
ncbi:MAG: hypothetical protein HKP61_07135 [Dactylosporangium sp.]|nr:hypothetical protein [Dactylosporangium sp.]